MAALYRFGDVEPDVDQQCILLGRDAELQQLHDALAASMLVSVVGACGIGKTRLAAAATRAQGVHAVDGVVWIDLSDVADADVLMLRVATRIGAQARDDTDALDAVIAKLRELRLLLVLDHCDLLLDAVRRLVAASLAAAPKVRWLLTSQAPLGLDGEHALQLGPLALPAAGMGLQEALDCGALALLQRRARAADDRFEITPATLGAAIDICRRLDGVALAIEIAAARLPSMGVQGVLDRLDEFLRLHRAECGLAGLRRSSSDAALAWSHRLLSATEQAVFRRLAPFRGSFSTEAMSRVAAEAEPAGARVSAGEAVGALARLVDLSLVDAVQVNPAHVSPALAHWRAASGAAGERYRLPESMRRFARERLAEAGETEAAAQRHADAMATLADAVAAERWTLGDAALGERVQPDLDNLRAALDWAVRGFDAARAASLFEALCIATLALDIGCEVSHWAPRLEALLKIAEPRVAARILVGLASGPARNAAPRASLELNRRAWSALGANGSPRERFQVLCLIAIDSLKLEEPAEAAAALAEARAIEAPDWPPMLRMQSRFAAGLLAQHEGELADAFERYTQVVAVALQAGHERAANEAALHLIDVAAGLGRLDDVVRCGRALVARLRHAANAYLLGFALGNLGGALLQQGEIEAGAQACLEALPLLRREQYVFWLFDHLAHLAVQRRRHALALTLSAYADVERAAQGGVRAPWEQSLHERVMAHAQAALTFEEQNEARALGAALRHPQADALAQNLRLAPAHGARRPSSEV